MNRQRAPPAQGPFALCAGCGVGPAQPPHRHPEQRPQHRGPGQLSVVSPGFPVIWGVFGVGVGLYPGAQRLRFTRRRPPQIRYPQKPKSQVTRWIPFLPIPFYLSIPLFGGGLRIKLRGRRLRKDRYWTQSPARRRLRTSPSRSNHRLHTGLSRTSPSRTSPSRKQWQRPIGCDLLGMQCPGVGEEGGDRCYPDSIHFGRTEDCSGGSLGRSSWDVHGCRRYVVVQYGLWGPTGNLTRPLCSSGCRQQDQPRCRRCRWLDGAFELPGLGNA